MQVLDRSPPFFSLFLALFLNASRLETKTKQSDLIFVKNIDFTLFVKKKDYNKIFANEILFLVQLLN